MKREYRFGLHPVAHYVQDMGCDTASLLYLIIYFLNENFKILQEGKKNYHLETHKLTPCSCLLLTLHFHRAQRPLSTREIPAQENVPSPRSPVKYETS